MAQAEYAKRLLSAVLSRLRQEDVYDAAEPRAADHLGRAAAFSETAFRDRRRRHRMDRGATALHGSLVGGPPSLWTTIAGCNRSSTNRPVLTSSASSGRPSRMTGPAS